MAVISIHETVGCNAHIEPGVKQSVERVSAISPVKRHHTITVTATEKSHSPVMIQTLSLPSQCTKLQYVTVVI